MAPRPAHPRPTLRDKGTRQGRRRLRCRAASDRVVPCGKARIGPTRLKSAPIRRKSAPTRPKSGRLGLYRPVSAETAESGRNSKKKKKKKVQTHRFTNLKTPKPLTFRPASLTPSLISLLCVTHCAPMKKHPSIPAVLRPSS